MIEDAYRLGEAMGISVWCTDQAGPLQTVPHPGIFWQPQGYTARQTHEYIRNGTAKVMTLFHPADGQVRVKGARALAHLGEPPRPESRPLAEDAARDPGAHPARRSQLVTLRVAEQGRSRPARGAVVRRDLGSRIADLGRRPEAADPEPGRLVRVGEPWREKEHLLRSAPGIGPVVSRTLVAALPGLGFPDGKRVAALVGPAPRARESGKMRGQRMIGGGRSTVRTALSMAAVVAIAH